jgi:hypothetical protein
MENELSPIKVEEGESTHILMPLRLAGVESQPESESKAEYEPEIEAEQQPEPEFTEEVGVD